jgi:O-antigen biosynthesis protein
MTAPVPGVDLQPGMPDIALNARRPPELEVAAFYLPQFHEIAENNEWWGEGFTEWTKVKGARPLYPGHLQPQVPRDGYYALDGTDVLQRQFSLAARHGITAFCMYAYWFGGRRLLEKPLRRLLDSPELEVRYFLCWANESWSRVWDGGNADLLLEQRHSAQGDARIIDDLAEHLADPRYVRIDGKPVFLIYRAELLDEPGRTIDALRERAQAIGIGELHLSMVQSFNLIDPAAHGFDSAVEFPPHGSVEPPNIIEPSSPEWPELYDPAGWEGTLVDYGRTVNWALAKATPTFRWFRSAMPGWDNSPRRGVRSTVYVKDNVQDFRRWLDGLVDYTYRFGDAATRLLFINSWNEWGEGAQLEPDIDRGDARLQAVASAVQRAYQIHHSSSSAPAAPAPLNGAGVA